MREFTLEMLSQGRLHKEDKCRALNLARDCENMLVKTREIYEFVGK